MATESVPYTQRIRGEHGQVLDRAMTRTCGACGLRFDEVPNAGREAHPRHGSCPRCGDRDTVAERDG